MATECAFCKGRGPMTKEHVLPAWIGRLPSSPSGATTYTLDATDGEQKVWNHLAFDVKVRNVCKACNNGWMSHLEASTKPILTPLFEGLEPVLDVTSQLTLATWAIKTALVVESLSHGSANIPVAHYRALVSNQTPPPGIQVWAGRYGPSRFDVIYKSCWKMAYDPPKNSEVPAHGAFTSVIATRSVWFQIIGIPPELNAKVVYGKEALPYVQQIWPSPGATVWGPPLMNDAQLTSLARHFIRGT